MRIVVLDKYTIAEVEHHFEALREIAEVQLYDRTAYDQVVERSKDADILLTNKVILDEPILKQLPRLKYVGVLATGYNVIDAKQAAEQQIIVSNVPEYSTASVAQLVFAMLLELVNATYVHGQSVRSGAWSRCEDFSYTIGTLTELEGLTMGLVGLGHIGKRVARIARAFGLNVVGNSRTPKEIPGVNWTDLDHLIKESDIISLHCPLNPQTAKMVDSSFLQQMKPNAYLINTGRGGLIDELALAEALNAEVIAGAALDVLSEEPPSPANPLLTATNCLITPHVGWATLQAKKRLIEISISNIKSFMDGNPINRVI